MKKIFIILLALLSCSKETSSVNNSDDEVVVSPKFSVQTNETNIIAPNIPDIRYLVPTISDVTGYTHYNSTANENYMLFFGNVWDEFNYDDISQVEPAPSIVLKKIENVWAFHKVYYESKLWTARTFKILNEYITVGDGNEIGSDFRKWKGDIWRAKILTNGDLEWARVNSDENRGFWHGISSGDLNGDGLQDIGGTPGINHDGTNIFIQKSNGNFDRDDSLINFEGNHPFCIDFHDLTGDGINEIIWADYGGGTATDDDDHEIRVYKFDNSTQKFELFFKDNNPDFYNWGLGGTSIVCKDLNGDNHDDIVVAREDGVGSESKRGFEVWLNNGDGSFKPKFSKQFSYENLSFQEFKIFDANNDGFEDILLNGYGFGKDFRIFAQDWNIEGSKGVKLNKLIWLNNGDGTFESYDLNDLVFEGPTPFFLHPYLDNGILHFFGIYQKNEFINNGLKAYTYDFKIDIKN